MKYTDNYIAMKLRKIGETGFKAAPIEGIWETAPYDMLEIEQNSYALIIKDSVLKVAVNRVSGKVILIDNNMDTSLINTTLEQFCNCALRWRDVTDVLDDIDDEKRELLAYQLENELKIIDELAFQDENQVWPTGIEEFSYGI